MIGQPSHSFARGRLRWHQRIGVRLSLALALTFGVLGLISSSTTSLAFRRSQQSVTEQSTEALETVTRAGLAGIVVREARLIEETLLTSARMTQSAASYLSYRLADASETAARSDDLTPDLTPDLTSDFAPELTERLVRTPSGNWYDANEARRSEVYIHRDYTLTPEVLRDVVDSRMLDAVFAGLLAGQQDAVGIYFISPQSVTRYYPVIDLHTMLDAPDFSVNGQAVYQLAEPDNNPERRTLWTPPYLDDAGNGLLVTVLSPVYLNDEFRGVIDVDVSLSRLAERLSNLPLSTDGFAFLLDDAGHLIAASPRANAALGEGSTPIAFGTLLPLTDAPAQQTLVRDMLAGRAGLGRLGDGDEASVVAFAPLPELGWSLAIGTSRALLTGPSQSIAQSVAAEASRALRGSLIASALAFVLALGSLSFALRHFVTRPIRALAAGTERLGAGELGVTLPSAPQGELRVLGEAFNRMSRTLAVQQDELLRYRDELERRVEARTQEIAGLLQLSTELSSTLETRPLLALVLARLYSFVPFRIGHAWRANGDTLTLLAEYPVPSATSSSSRSSSSKASTWVVPCSDALREVLRQGEPVFAERATGEAAPPWLRRIVTYDRVLLVPLVVQKRPLGMLVLQGMAPPNPRQQALAASVARQAAVALDNIALYERSREQAAVDERQRLARELHDSVNQVVFSIALGLRTAQHQMEHDPPSLKASLEYAIDLSDVALSEMRALIYELRPETLEHEGLLGLLERQADALRARHNLQVTLTGLEPPLPLDSKQALYRVAQEALHNIVKHAHARTVSVTLRQDDTLVTLDIHDDGRGFDAHARAKSGVGLSSMRERIQLLGGTFELCSDPGHGTRIVAAVPRSHTDEVSVS